MRRGVNGVIPFAMELVLLQVHSPNFLIRHLPAGRVFPAIQTTSHLEQWIAPGRRGFTDARRGLAIAAIPLGGAAAAGYNTYGGVGGPAPRNTPRTSLLDQVATALRRALLAAGLLRLLARAQLRTPILGRLLARLPRDQALADGGVFGRVDYVLVPGGQYADRKSVV